jgi:hypothetical protein
VTWGIAVFGALLLLALGVALADVFMHPEREDVIHTLRGGDVLVRSQVDRWLTGRRFEIRRLHEGRVVASHPDWETNFVTTHHGVVEIGREGRITVLDYDLRPLAEITPPPGTAVFDSVDWVAGLLLIRSRPLDIHQTNQLEVRDGTTLEVLYVVPIDGTSTIAPFGDRVFVVSEVVGIRQVTRDGLVWFSAEGEARDPCPYWMGFAWFNRTDGRATLRTFDGPPVALDYDVSGRTLERCLHCPDHTFVLLAESIEHRSSMRYEGDPTGAFTPGLDPAAPLHVVGLDRHTGARRWAYSTWRGFHPDCEAGVLSDGELTLRPLATE